MKRSFISFSSLTLTVVCIAVLVGCTAGSRTYRAGRRAEAVKDYDGALANYSKAVDANPRNARFLASQARARNESSLYHLKKGREALEQGQTEQAATEFQRALMIDPSNLAARQNLDRVARQLQAARNAQEAERREEERKRMAIAAELPLTMQLKPLPEEPLKRFRVSADGRELFIALGKLAGINVAFTPDFQPRPMRLDLTDVTLEQALDILALQTKTFWKPITSNTIVVIPDTARNRRDHEDQVLKTIHLTNPSKPETLAAMVSTIKSMLNIREVVENADVNAVVIRAEPAKIRAAEKIIRDLDRGRGEVLMDLIVLEADRTRMRDLGITPAQQFQLFSNTGNIGLNRLGSISSRDYSITLPGAVAAILMTDSKTRILQNPNIRVTEGEEASLRIGSRFPFATGSFQPGALTGGLQPLVSTQFQYQDLGVNLDITPEVLPGGDISLELKVEISSLQTTINLGGGLTQPVFGQRTIEHTIRLREGEATLLGGLVERSETRTVAGWPGLGRIPGLKYLFSVERKELIETEVVILVRPRLVREVEIAESSLRAIPLGSGSGADVPAAAPARRAAPQPQRPQPPRQQ